VATITPLSPVPKGKNMTITDRARSVPARVLRRLRSLYRSLLCILLGKLIKDYPDAVNVWQPNHQTIDFIKRTSCSCIAEIGIYQGHTSQEFAKYLGGRGALHLFDFEERVHAVKDSLNQMGYHNVVAHGSSHKLLDSYNWQLMRVLQAHAEPIYDYVLLDGAHTWAIDALTFSLIDRLLKKGGYVDFDDYHWSLESSPSINPTTFPLTGYLYTPEQVKEQQVKLIVDLLVKRDSRYSEIIESKIFQKLA
jgi:hypothetical protein